MAVTYKDINQLTQKSPVAGTEKIPVSSTQYITPNQIAGLAPSPKIYVGTCETAASTAAKVATVETFPLDANDDPLVGTTIAVKFSYTNSANNPTLAVNGTTAASIYYNYGIITTANVSVVAYADRYILYVWDGTYWVWLSWGIDMNTIAYLIRTDSSTKVLSTKLYQYRLLFTSADGEKWVPANASTSTSTTTSKTVTSEKIDPFGEIVFYNSTTTKSADSTPSILVQYRQASFSLGYSFNTTGSALTMTSNRPVYVKAAPQSDGSVIIDSSTPFVQSLPSTEDGKVYIFLGIAYSTTQIELVPHHPVYYYKDGQIRLWTNAETGFLKYYLCQDEAEYNNISTKDSGTLYLIPET